MEAYLPIVLMLGLGVIAGIVFTNINRWIGPKRPTEEKLSTYESGMEPVKTARERFSVKFYLVAMLFIVFDIEIVFMYPWAVKFQELGMAGFVEMLVFIAILLVGYLYIMKKGALRMALETLQRDGFLTARLDDVINWARKNSLWPMPMGISCCAIEMMATASPRFDISRFGSEVMRFTPRQCDVMIVAGTVTYKMSKVVRKIYDQMPDPKWVISMGACASSGGMFRSYSVVQGIDQFLPVDVFVAGCPPRPENLLHALIELQKKMAEERTVGKPDPRASRSISPNARRRRPGHAAMNQLIVERLQARFPASIRGSEEFRDDLTVTVRTADIVAVATVPERGLRACLRHDH